MNATHSDTIRVSGGKYANIDTSYKYIVMPSTDYSNFVVKLRENQKDIKNGFNCVNYTLSPSHCQAPSACSNYYSTMPDLVFTFEGVEFRIPPQGYVFSSDSTTCDIAVTQMETSVYVLGDIFFRNFAAIFNYTDNVNTMHFAVATHAPDGTEIIVHKTPWLLIVSVSLLALVGGVVGFILGRKRCQSANLKQDERASLFYPSDEKAAALYDEDKPGFDRLSSLDAPLK